MVFYKIEATKTGGDEQKELTRQEQRARANEIAEKSECFFQKCDQNQLILHNQRYYLMAHNEHWGNITFYRVDHITNMIIDERPSTPITELTGFKSGIDYKTFASSMPYMYTDEPQNIEFIAHKGIVDQIIDWFGLDIRITEIDKDTISVNLKASPNAMEHWATQYINYVEVIKPAELREKIRESLKKAEEKYK